MIADIIIGKPICKIESLGLDNPIYTEERFLPKILVDLGITKSTSEIRRNRPDLVRTLDKPDCIDIKIGKHRLYIVIGE